MKRKILLLIVMLPLFSLAQQGIITSPLNPAFIKYREQYLSGKVTLISDDGHSLGYIPSPKTPVKKTISTNAPGKAPLFPPVYDLRTLGLITPVKNQGGCGSCWAFATMSSIESGWKVLGMSNNDLSENNLKDCHGFDYGPCDGGQSTMCMSYFVRQGGPVYESSDPYVDYPVACVTGLPLTSYEGNARMVSNDMNEIKQAVMDYGGIYTAFYWDGSYYNGSNYTYYYNGSSEPNHAVTIAGWDDSKVTAGGTGAWIIKNSWGTWWGQNGYFYISYNDSKINSEVCYYPYKLTINPSSKIYNYSNLGECYDLGFGSNTAYGLAKFVTTNNYPLTRIGVWISNFNGTADIEVYDNFDGTTLSGLLASLPTQNLVDWGYYTFDLPTPVNLGNGNDFYVKVKYYTPNYNTPIPVEAVVSGYSSAAVIQTGVCWASTDGATWTAMGNGTSYPYNLCISAYTANEPAAPVTTAGSVAACPGNQVTIPLTVTGFTDITVMNLRLEYDPTLLSYSSYTNVNSSLTGMSVKDSLISGNLHAIMIKWTGTGSVTLTSGSDMVDLVFNYLSGSPVLTFNNSDHFGWDCQYLDSQRGSLYDNPVSNYFVSGTVTPSSGPSPTITGPNNPCDLSQDQAYTTEAGMTNYSWSASSGGTITSGQGTNTIEVTWNQSGTQTVSVNYTSISGCSAPSPTVYNVNVQPLPSAAGNVGGSQTVCAGDQNVAYWTAVISGAESYGWDLPSGASIVSGQGSSYITVNYASSAISGIVRVYGQNACGNGTPSPDYYVTVNPIPPAPVITLSDFCLNSNAPDGNQWFNENGMIAGATSQSFCPPSALHTYYDIVTLSGCSSDTSNKITYENTGIESESGTSFKVYPNPAQASFTVEADQSVAGTSVPELFNILGNQVKTFDRDNITGTKHKWIFECRNISGGVYYIKLMNGNELMVQKIVIKP